MTPDRCGSCDACREGLSCGETPLRPCCRDALTESVRECIRDFADIEDPELVAYLVSDLAVVIMAHECTAEAVTRSG